MTMMSEEEFLALDPTLDRVELLDGRLVTGPLLNNSHQRVSSLLASALDGPAEAAGLFALKAVNVRLRPGRIVIPDVIVADTADDDEQVLEARQLTLVAEVVARDNTQSDLVVKMRCYAEAGIAWYLLAEQEPPGAVTLRLHRLDGGRYVEDARRDRARRSR
ncbi:Uma2 family endonuclease [Dactylosporangium sp. NPDC049742]|uniref:Uma2 family endonuclease n=1 Tax=Dactylosporangium sp. NPDC049742 TaxID=3154737 RepID=UPI0034461822